MKAIIFSIILTLSVSYAANAQQEDVAEAKKLRKRHDRMADEMNTMMPILSAVSPAEQIALQKKFARAEAGELPPAPAIPIQPMEFSQAAEDRGPLPFRPVRPAADGSKIVKTDLQTQVETQGTDSPANAADAARLPDNLMDLYAAG